MKWLVDIGRKGYLARLLQPGANRLVELNEPAA